MSVNLNFINRFFLIGMLAWTSLISLAVLSSFYSNNKYAEKLAKNEAISIAKKETLHTLLAGLHKNVNAFVIKDIHADQYILKSLNHDKNSSALIKLTQKDLAYIRLEIMKEYAKLYGSKVHITSTRFLNPENAPDEWEKAALEKMRFTRKSFFEKTKIDEEEYFRYIRPLFAENSCLKCHIDNGYKLNDLIGGVSVSVSVKAYLDDVFSHMFFHSFIAFIIWLFGLGAIFYIRNKAEEIVKDKIKDYEQNIYSLVDIIENRDSYTAGHTKRVAKYAVLIAKEMGFSKEKIDELYKACMLHDIGKISTPDSILLKPGSLTEREYKIIKEHVTVGYELLKKVDVYKNIAKLVYCHHERYDGSGYPRGLKGEQIPILSQIMSIADSFDAMTTNRVYKIKISAEEAFFELEKCSGKQFNKRVVEATFKALSGVKVYEDVSQKPKTELEKERFAYFYKDQLTGVYNRNYLETVLLYDDDLALYTAYGISLKNFSQYNKNHSWLEGDKLLVEIAKELKNISENSCVFRLYGDDFIILIKEEIDIEKKLYRLNDILRDTNVKFSCKRIDLKKPEDLQEL